MSNPRRLKVASMLPEMKLNDARKHSYSGVRKSTRRPKLSMPLSVEQAAWMLEKHPAEIVTALMYQQLHDENNKEVK